MRGENAGGARHFLYHTEVTDVFHFYFMHVDEAIAWSALRMLLKYMSGT